MPHIHHYPELTDISLAVKQQTGGAGDHREVSGAYSPSYEVNGLIFPAEAKYRFTLYFNLFIRDQKNTKYQVQSKERHNALRLSYRYNINCIDNA